MSLALAIDKSQEEVFEFFNKGLSHSTGVGEET